MGCFKNDKAGKALKLRDEMKEKEIAPSVITYNSIIAGLCQMGKTNQARVKLNELLESDLVPGEITYSMIIHGHCREDQVEKAFQFHNKMVENKVKPNAFPCNVLFVGFAEKVCLENLLSSSTHGFQRVMPFHTTR